MKTHVVTYLHNNYGSILQAYALQSKLSELGAEPDLIIEKKVENHSKFMKILSFLKPKNNYSLFTRIKIRVQSKKFKFKIKKITEFKKKYFKIISLETSSYTFSNEDIFIAGSDQIWSVLNGELSDWYTLQWCTDNFNKYSYAASMGYINLNDEQKEQFKKKLSDFRRISFREEQAASLLNDVFNGRVRCDVDPTLLYDEKFWNKLASKKIMQRKYIFLYVLRPNEELIKHVGIIGKQLNMDVIYIGQTADIYKDIKTVCDAGIEDFLSYIKNAEMVITNSFHGTVFSILFHRKFVSVRIDSTSSRVENLLEKTGLTDHIVTDLNDIASIISKGIPYSKVDCKLEEYRQKSIEYIKEIIGYGGER